MNFLTVSTLTRWDRPAGLAGCALSVQRNLPPDSEHIITSGARDFQKSRWVSVQVDSKYLTWVDDDDLVENGALEICCEALEKTGAAVAFTDERYIDKNGKSLGVQNQTTHLRDIAMHPRAVHHLAVVRRDSLTPQIYSLARQVGIGIDWLLRAIPALTGGVVHVPIVGYSWRQHSSQASASLEWEAQYKKALPELRKILQNFLPYDRQISLFERT